MSFRATVVIGDRKGKVGIGVQKGKDVAQAMDKATRAAKKRMITVPVISGTIPHEVYAKVGSSKILIKPQIKGRGIVAGGAARAIFNLAGIKNITAKYISTTKNKLNNALVAFEALKKLKYMPSTSNVNKENAVATPETVAKENAPVEQQ